jgi:hypothetical protein
MTALSGRVRGMVVAMIGIALFAAACHRQTRGDCLLGTKVGADGNVVEAKEVFAGSEPIFLTLRSARAKAGVQITVQIVDSKGEEVKSLFKSTDNETSVTFPIRNLTAGKYTAKATWGDAKMCDAPFEIR